MHPARQGRRSVITQMLTIHNNPPESQSVFICPLPICPLHISPAKPPSPSPKHDQSKSSPRATLPPSQTPSAPTSPSSHHPHLPPASSSRQPTSAAPARPPAS